MNRDLYDLRMVLERLQKARDYLEATRRFLANESALEELDDVLGLFIVEIEARIDVFEQKEP